MEAPAGREKIREMVERRDGGQKTCRQDMSFPQVPHNDLRRGSGEVYRSAVIVQGDAMSREKLR